MPSRLTISAETNVAATPINAHNPLKPPIIVGFRPETIPSKWSSLSSQVAIQYFEYHHLMSLWEESDESKMLRASCINFLTQYQWHYSVTKRSKN